MSENQTPIVDDGSLPQEPAIELPPPKIQIKLNILQVIKQKQAENGMKHLDYETYRRYCAKRLRKLRIQLDLKHKKENKFTPAVHKKKGVKEVESTEQQTESTPSVVDGMKNTPLYSKKNITTKIVQRYTEKKQVQERSLREQIKRVIIRENIEKQIDEQKEQLLASFAKKKKKQQTSTGKAKSSKNLQYDPEFLSELYKQISIHPDVDEALIDERIKKNQVEEDQDVVKGDERFLHLLLVQAERCWSQSRHLRNEMKQYPTNSRIKFHQLKRLKKAVKWASLLLNYCNLFSDDQRTILEAEAYHSYLLGLYHLEKEEWGEALKLFKQSQTVYDQLYKVLTSVAPQIREEYKNHVNDIAVTYIRRCEYNLKNVEGGEELLQELESSSQIDAIQMKLDQVKDAETKNAPQQNVEWEGVMSIIVPNEKIRVSLLAGRSLMEAEYKTVESKLRAFDKLFGIYNDTTRMIREEMKASTSNTKSKSGQASNLSNLSPPEQLNQLRFLHSYVSYMLGVKTIERNIIMLQSLLERFDTIQQQVQKERVEKKQKTNPIDIIRLFDGLLQNVNDLQDILQGININPQSAQKLTDELQDQKQVFTNYRCYYMAHAYAVQHKWVECYSLLERSEKLISSLTSKKSTYGLPEPKTILSDIRKDKITARAQAVLSKKSQSSVLSGYDSDEENGTAATKKNTELKKLFEQPLSDRLDTFITPNKFVAENLNEYKLINLPPHYQLIPGKPVFFDIANSLVSDYPTDEIDSQIKELSANIPATQPEKKEEEKKKGWFGLW